MHSFLPARSWSRNLLVAVFLSVVCHLPTTLPVAQGGALKFDGTDDFVQTPLSNVPRDGTVEAWVKTASNVRQSVVSSHGNEEFRLQLGYRPGTAGNSPGFLGLNVRYGTLRAYADIGAPMYDGSWHHVAFAWEGGSPGTIRAYWDGQEKPVTYGLRGDWAGNSNRSVVHVIGRECLTNSLYYFNGTIDEVRFWDKARTTPEIQEAMKREISGSETGLVGYWKFNEGQGTTAYDGSPNKNDGTVNGASWTPDGAPIASDVAFGAAPTPSAVDTPHDVILSWKPSESAAAHDVYLGTSFADVNTASRVNPLGVLVSRGQTATIFDPAGTFAYGQTYYWRVDEVDKDNSTIFKGNVWSFTTEPYGYPVKPVAAAASSSQPGMGPEKTIDGSGLSPGDRHGTEPSTMWLSAGVQPNWIQYEFDRIYKLNDLKVWNSNQMIESFLGFGARSVKIEASSDGTTWTPIANVPEFARAPGTPDCAANTTVSLGGVEAKYVKLTINSNWSGMAPQTGLSEVRFSYVPMQARAPQPATAATGISVETSLDWRPGRGAASHKVYLGTDPNAVANGIAAAKTVSEPGYSPDSLSYGTTYYWRVDEVNTVTYPGDVWSFTTQEYAVVEDFESYTDRSGAEVFSAWIDGFTDGTNGSTVGHMTATSGTFGETTIVHGGRQSMPLAYDNTKAPNYSEATWTFDAPQDWTTNGIKSLSLWFQGVAGNGGQLYLKINSTKVTYDGDAADLARSAWQVWNIDLSKAGKIDSVRSLTVGIEGPGAKGILYIDDIRLYPKTPEYVTPVQPAATGLVAHYTFDEGSGTTVKDSSGKGNHGTFGPEGTPKWVAGKFGGALQLDGNDDYVNIDALAKSMPADNNFTVSAWIRTATADVTRLVIASNDTTGGHDFELGVAANGNLLIQANTARNYPPKLSDDQWHMITYVRDTTTAYLYIDGSLVGTETPSGNPATQARWSIGQEWDPPSPSDEYQGTVDDVRVYARPLSAAEVAGLAGQTKSKHKPF